MRIITSYACTLDVETAEEASWRFNLYRGVMDDWLHDQGISDPRADSPSDTFIQLTRRDVSHEGAEIDGFLLKQPIEESSHVLHTRFDLGVRDCSLALFLQFSVERRTNRIAPTSIQIGCPRALATILDSGDWRSGQVRLRPHSRRAVGTNAGRQLHKEIMDPERTLPFVLLANLNDAEEGWHQRDTVDPYGDAEWGDFVNRLEDDLGGVAQLIDLDTSAANALIPPDLPPRKVRQRPALGYRPPQFSEWGMSGSLVRVYWPLGTQGFSPEQHPAWAPFEHYYEVDEDDAYDYPVHQGGSGMPPPSWVTLFRGHELMAVRSEIRDVVYEQAALQPLPALIDDIRRLHAASERERLTEDGDFREWQEYYDDELEQKDQTINSLRESLNRQERNLEAIQDELDGRKATIEQLKYQLNAQNAAADDEEIAEEAGGSRDPVTVAEAVAIARSQCAGLSFGPHATDKLDVLNSNAGPPRKILSDLKLLNQCSQLLQEGGSLGQDVIAWLKGQNVNASKESSTRMNRHATELTFSTARDTYELMGDHIKYRAGGLDREVRIHFKVHASEVNGETATIDIGYIGQKVMPV